MKSDFKYWNQRAKDAYVKDDDIFYTISPIPVFVKRRGIFKDKVLDLAFDKIRILDFGCGDGWMIAQIENRFTNINLTGLDISDHMLDVAKSRNTKAEFILSQTGIPNELKFDFVYSSAVFAHIDDSSVERLWRNIHSALLEGGSFLVFEQIAPFRVDGNTYTRRTTSDYVNIGEKTGFQVVSNSIISFKYHTYFERYISKIFYKCISGASESEKRVKANKSKIFRLVSMIFLLFDFNYIYDAKELRWGYVMIQFAKSQK